MRCAVCFVLVANVVSAISLHQDPLAKPYYDLQFSETPITNAEASSRRLQDQQAFKYRILNDGKEKYLCAIPNVTVINDAKSQEDRRRIAQAEKEESVRATQRGWELLQGMEGSCLYWIVGWWTYKFCYSEGITQFHAMTPAAGMAAWPPTEDVNAGVYSLGKHPTKSGASSEAAKETDIAKFKTTGDSKALSINYEKGTYCPIIGAERKTEVQFQCYTAANDRISLVKETSSCQYLIVIQTPRLCHDVAFQVSAQEPSNTINCNPISDEKPLPALDASSQTLPPSMSDSTKDLEAGQQAQSDAEKEEDALDAKVDAELSHLAFDEIPSDLPEMIKVKSVEVEAEAERKSEPVGRTGGQQPPLAKARTPEDERFDAAIEMARDIADQLEDGTLKVHGESIFAAENADVEFEVELQDERGEALGHVVMSVVDGQVRVVLEDTLADAHVAREQAHADALNRAARDQIPDHVQAHFARFVAEL